MRCRFQPRMECYCMSYISTKPCAPMTADVERQCSQQLSRLDSGLAVLSENVSALESRLRGVLSPHETPGDKAGPQPALVPVAESLYGFASRVDGLNLQVASMINRIEL